jgi:translation elongation factor EF-1alpha
VPIGSFGQREIDELARYMRNRNKNLSQSYLKWVWDKASKERLSVKGWTTSEELIKDDNKTTEC